MPASGRITTLLVVDNVTKPKATDPADSLFKACPEAVRALQKQAKREKRQADRKAWKARQKGSQ